jgi:hypothetical protein
MGKEPRLNWANQESAMDFRLQSFSLHYGLVIWIMENGEPRHFSTPEFPQL